MTTLRLLACTALLALSFGSQQCLGFTTTSVPTMPATATSTSTSTRQHPSELYMYPRKAAPSQSAPPSKVAQQMIPNPTSISPTSSSIRGTKPKKTAARRTRKHQHQRYNTELSNSVLADCNTLPSFPTAHGILSPETVMRMEEMAEADGHPSVAVERFLKQYRRQGPMSCLSMLSDPDVLPHLTKAMRDVV